MGRTLRIRGETGSEADADAEEDAETVRVPEATLSRVLRPTNLELLRAIHEGDPGSIRATAEAVDRDVKNVHENLMELSRLGVVEFEWDGRARRPVFPYDSLAVSVSLGE